MWVTRDKDAAWVWLWRTKPKRRRNAFGSAGKIIGWLNADDFDNAPAPGQCIEIEPIVLVAVKRPTIQEVARNIRRIERRSKPRRGPLPSPFKVYGKPTKRKGAKRER